MSNWSQDLGNMVFTLVKVRFPEKLKTKYPKIRFTTLDESRTEARFPTVKIKVSAMSEDGNDTENTEINAVNMTVQIDVISNVSQSEVNTIMDAVLTLLKDMRFNGSNLPIQSQEGDVYRSVMRVRRRIGSGDTL